MGIRYFILQRSRDFNIYFIWMKLSPEGWRMGIKRLRSHSKIPNSDRMGISILFYEDNPEFP